MQGEHANPGKIGGGGDCACDRVGNIVEFQIEEDAGSESGEPFDRSPAFSRKQLTAYFKKACHAPEPARQKEGRPQAIYIQGDD